MPNTHQTLQDIADILSFESDAASLKARLSSEAMDWDHLVRVGSSHLVLPAIYCRMKAKGLLETLPEELEVYLKEITNLNRERNQQLLAEARQISHWFQEVNIDHVFLKGTAMLASGYYEDLAERMVGDLDILVEKNKLHESYNLLLNHDYKPLKNTSDPEYQEKFRHLTRLISSDKIGAIEIHRHLLRIKNKLVEPIHILGSKKKKNKLFIPSHLHLFHHNIFNFMINDYGNNLYNLNMRNWYDSEVILTHKKTGFPSNKYKVMFEFYKEILSNKKGIHFFQKQAISNTRFYKFYHYLNHITRLSLTLPSRMISFLLDKKYRREVLNDIERIKSLFKYN